MWFWLVVWGDLIVYFWFLQLYVVVYVVFGFDWIYECCQVLVDGFLVVMGELDVSWCGFLLIMLFKELVYCVVFMYDCYVELIGVVNIFLFGLWFVGFNIDVGGIVDVLFEGGIEMVEWVCIFGVGVMVVFVFVVVVEIGVD